LSARDHLVAAPARRRFPVGSKAERHSVRSFPTGRKKGKNPVDKIGGLLIRLVLEGRVHNMPPPPGRRGERTHAQTDAENAEPISRRRGEVPWSWRRGNGDVGGEHQEKKMLINDERSRNVYENKQNYDTFTDINSDISTQFNDILYRSTHVLQKPSGLLPFFARWGKVSFACNDSGWAAGEAHRR
jgi:hypothetical protein